MTATFSRHTWVKLEEPGGAVSEVSAGFRRSLFHLHRPGHKTNAERRFVNTCRLKASGEPRRRTWTATYAGSTLFPLRWTWI